MLTGLHILWDDQANAGDDNAGSFEFDELTCDMIEFCESSCVYSMELQCLSGGLLVIEMPLQSSILSTEVQLGFNCLASPPGPLLESGGQGVMTLWLHFILASGAEFDILDYIFDFMRCQFQISYHLTFIIS